MDNPNTQNPDNSPVCKNVRLNQISPPAFQPRKYFDEAAMAELTSSVQQQGILQPILVRPLGDEQYELVTGERRYKAAKAVSLTEIPVVVRQMSEAEAMQYALMENLQREDLNPIEETEGILRLLALKLNCSNDAAKSLLYRMKNEQGKKSTPKPQEGITPSSVSAPNESRGNVSPNADFEKVEEVFESLGKMNWQTFIRTRLSILKLPPEILEALRQGRIEYTKAQAIAKLKVESARLALLEEALDKSLSLSEIRDRIKAEQKSAPREELQARLEAIPKKMKKLKVWDDPDKREKVEALLAEMEMLLSE